MSYQLNNESLGTYSTQVPAFRSVNQHWKDNKYNHKYLYFRVCNCVHKFHTLGGNHSENKRWGGGGGVEMAVYRSGWQVV